MIKCFSYENFFLSEVLIILSCCLFVIMALLTAVISVTNKIFEENEIDEQKLINCPFPSKFYLKNYPLLNNIKYEEKLTNLFLTILENSLNNFLISKNYIDTFIPINNISDLKSNEFEINNELINLIFNFPNNYQNISFFLKKF